MKPPQPEFDAAGEVFNLAGERASDPERDAAKARAREQAARDLAESKKRQLSFDL